MKSLILIVGLIFIICQVDGRAVEYSPDKLDEDDLACINELHLNIKEMAAVDTGKTIPETDNFAKFIGCGARKQGYITASNHIDFTIFKERMLEVARNDPDFTPEFFKFYKLIVISSIDGCHQSDHGEDVEHTLIKTLNCITKKIDELTEE